MNIFRYYNQNRKTIWLVIIAIIILIIAIQAINNIIKNQNVKTSNNTINEKEYENNLNINILISNESVEEDEKLIIDQFIRYCNAGKIQDAYNLLTENCKNELFPTIEHFKNNYYNIYFLTTKLYSKEHFVVDTYKIKLYDDILSTGNVNTNAIEDYFTLEKQKDDTIKLNISNYIGNKKINIKNTDENLQIKIVKKDIYKEYEKYELEVTNLTYNTILLDSKENTKTMYLVGDNNVKYYSISHEILKENLIIKPKATVKISIKYNKEYNSNRTVNQVVFSDIIPNYELYQNTQKKSEYKDRTTLKVYL